MGRAKNFREKFWDGTYRPRNFGRESSGTGCLVPEIWEGKIADGGIRDF